MDQIVLYPPGGSPPAPSFIGLGSWLGGDTQPDYGARGLIQSIESSNALRDGGQFAFRHAPVRKMQVPLILNPYFGVDHLVNPGFESGQAPLGLNGSWLGIGLTSAVLLEPQPSLISGSYGCLVFVSGAPVASAAGIRQPVNLSQLRSGEPFLLGGLFVDFASRLGEVTGLQMNLQVNPGAGGFPVYPDTPAPGYIFGITSGGSLNVGSFVLMDVPRTWTRIGGLIGASAVQNILAVATAAEVQFSVASGLPGSVGGGTGSNIVLVMDDLQWATGLRQRAVNEWEGQIREYATPGAYIAVQPEGVPTSEAVFFDVLDGRWEPDYNIYENRAGIRRGTLYLDTQPWGYWPTEIILASAASCGPVGQIPLNGASVIGDVPPLAHVTVMPTVASVYVNSSMNSWLADMAAVSFGGRPSFTAMLPIGSLATCYNSFAPTLISDQYAPSGQAQALLMGNTTGALLNQAYGHVIPSALEPAYRGRFRVFGLAKMPAGVALGTASAVMPMQMLIDADRSTGDVVWPPATGNQIATAWSVIEQSSNPLHFSATNAYDILDFGEITLPPNASGQPGPVRLRWWYAFATTLNPAATFQVNFGGLFLLPVDGAAGIQTRGMVVPSILSLNNPTQAGLEANAQFVEQVQIVATQGIPYQDARGFYRGVPLRIGASTNSLTLMTADRYERSVGLPPVQIAARAALEWSQVSVSYRPQFQFLYGV